MKSKNLLFLCIIFAALIGVVLIKKSAQPPAAVREETTDIITFPLSLDTVTEIIFQLGGTDARVHLVKEQDGWKVKSQYGVSADTEIAGAFLKKLDALAGELRSTDGSLLGDYGISDEEGIHLTFNKDAAEAAHLIVGAKRTASAGNFIRHQKENKVYAVEENLLAEFGFWGDVKAENFQKDKWSDKRVVRFDPGAVVAVRVSEVNQDSEKVRLDLTRQEADGKKKWESASAYPFGLSATKIKEYLRTFENIRAREVTAPGAAGVFDLPLWKASVRLENGSEITLTRGRKDDQGQNYYLKTSEDYYFLVPVSTFDNFLMGGGDIFVSNPLDVQEQALTKMEVQDLTAKKTFSASKTLKAAEGEEKKETEEFVWKSPDGKEIETSKIQDIFQKFKGMNIYLVSADKMPAAGAFLIKFYQGEEVKTCTITAPQAVEGGRECQFLKIAGDPNAYCYTKGPVDTFRQAIPFP